jgi:1-acyl-sn-glycerol-3-phosphate acyltransferase
LKIFHYILNKAFDIKLYFNQKIVCTPGKIDILMVNHFSTIDIFIVMAILSEFDIDKFWFVAKKQLKYIPGMGLFLYMSKDIKLDREWSSDKENIKNQLKNIDEGIIYIFPEGTRATQQKIKDGQEFSKQNNLPIYNYTQVPRTKGIWLLINLLKEQDKFGKLYDLTIVVPSNSSFYNGSL